MRRVCGRGLVSDRREALWQDGTEDKVWSTVSADCWRLLMYNQSRSTRSSPRSPVRINSQFARDTRLIHSQPLTGLGGVPSHRRSQLPLMPSHADHGRDDFVVTLFDGRRKNSRTSSLDGKKQIKATGYSQSRGKEERGKETGAGGIVHRDDSFFAMSASPLAFP